MCTITITVYTLCKHKDPEATPPGYNTIPCDAANGHQSASGDCRSKFFGERSSSAKELCSGCEKLIETHRQLVIKINRLASKMGTSLNLKSSIQQGISELRKGFTEMARVSFISTGTPDEAVKNFEAQIEQTSILIDYIESRFSESPDSTTNNMPPRILAQPKMYLSLILASMVELISDTRLERVDGRTFSQILRGSFDSETDASWPAVRGSAEFEKRKQEIKKTFLVKAGVSMPYNHGTGSSYRGLVPNNSI